MAMPASGAASGSGRPGRFCLAGFIWEFVGESFWHITQYFSHLHSPAHIISKSVANFSQRLASEGRYGLIWEAGVIANRWKTDCVAGTSGSSLADRSSACYYRIVRLWRFRRRLPLRLRAYIESSPIDHFTFPLRRDRRRGCLYSDCEWNQFHLYFGGAVERRQHDNVLYQRNATHRLHYCR